MAKVLTPGGHRDSSKVHRIPAGQKLCFENDHYVLRDRLTGAPAKAVVPASLSPAGVANGWRAYAGWTNDTGTPVRSMIAQFTVPQPPARIGGQTVFLFPGIQNLDGDVGILQPVLQFGPSAIGGGPYWALASWYVPTTGEAFHSDELVPVQPGTMLTGRMTLTGGSGGGLQYACQFDGWPGTACHIEGIEELKWCNVTLEAYDVNSAADYPPNSPTQFEGLSISAAPGLNNINWTLSPAAAFGETVTVVNPSAAGGTVNISY